MNATADYLAEAFVGCLSDYLQRGDDCRVARHGDVVCVSTPLPIAQFNTVHVMSPSATTRQVEDALDELRRRALPHALVVRPSALEAMRTVVASRGLRPAASVPLLALETFDHLEPSALDEVVERVRGDEVAQHLDIVTKVFEIDRAWGDVLVPRSAADDDALHFYVGRRNGRAVATALGLHAGPCVGVFNVATESSHRGLGLATVLSVRCVRDAAAAGASVAVLQSSPLGYGVYSRIGFRLVEEWSVFVTPSPLRVAPALQITRFF